MRRVPILRPLAEKVHRTASLLDEGLRLGAAWFVGLSHVSLSIRPTVLLVLFIVLVPFARHDILEARILPLPGAKPFLLLGIYLLVVGWYHRPDSLGTPRRSREFGIALLLFFTIAVLRSLGNYSLIAWQVGDGWLSRPNYVLSFYVKPLLFTVPFWVITRYVDSRAELMRVMKAVFVSVTVLSAYLLFLYVVRVPNRADFSLVRGSLAQYLNLHGNDLANFYITALPLVFARMFRTQKPSTFLALGLCVFSLAILYSRAAYVSVAISLILFLLVSRRWRTLLVVGGAFALLIPVTASSVIDRLTTGFGPGGVDLEVLSAGRVAMIWTPLFREWISDPVGLFSGLGRYGLVTTDAFQAGAVLPVLHPHNLYLELALDIGLVGLIVMMTLMARVLLSSKRELKNIHDPELRDYEIGAIVGVVGFLISGIVGRSMFPRMENCFLWIALGILAVIPKVDRMSAEP